MDVLKADLIGQYRQKVKVCFVAILSGGSIKGPAHGMFLVSFDMYVKTYRVDGRYVRI